jgi:putative addiction module killer protein
MVKVVEYLDTAGRSPFGIWFDALDVAAAVKIRRAVARIEAGNFGDAKAVGKGVIERRIDVGPGYRLYFGRDGDELVILLAGGTKQRQQRDIEAAQKYWADYKGRRKG